MVPAPQLETPRLLLRGWRAADREAFADLNADPVVMEHFVSVLTRAESDGMVDRIEAAFAEHRFGLWAVEVRNGEPFIGFVGLAIQRFEAAFTPCVEVGWRLARAAWGHGYATEAATRVLDYAFDVLELDEVVSLTSTTNERSQAVMRRLGLTRNPADDFDHPNVPVGHALRRHVLYRIDADGWRVGKGR